MLGERLYTRIQVEQGSLAGKITGMLLESLDNSELVAFMHDHVALHSKIQEALSALEAGFPEYLAAHMKLKALLESSSPTQAGKITGMLLEGLDKSELVALIHDQVALQSKIQEALSALEAQLPEATAECAVVSSAVAVATRDCGAGGASSGVMAAEVPLQDSQ